MCACVCREREREREREERETDRQTGACLRERASERGTEKESEWDR